VCIICIKQTDETERDIVNTCLSACLIGAHALSPCVRASAGKPHDADAPGDPDPHQPLHNIGDCPLLKHAYQTVRRPQWHGRGKPAQQQPRLPSQIPTKFLFDPSITCTSIPFLAEASLTAAYTLACRFCYPSTYSCTGQPLPKRRAKSSRPAGAAECEQEKRSTAWQVVIWANLSLSLSPSGCFLVVSSYLCSVLHLSIPPLFPIPTSVLLTVRTRP
jgi:hypothetical protein